MLRFLSVSNLYMFWTYCHSFCEFTCTSALVRLEDGVLGVIHSLWILRSFFPFIHVDEHWRKVFNNDITFRAKSFMLWTLSVSGTVLIPIYFKKILLWWKLNKALVYVCLLFFKGFIHFLFKDFDHLHIVDLKVIFFLELQLCRNIQGLLFR